MLISDSFRYPGYYRYVISSWPLAEIDIWNSYIFMVFEVWRITIGLAEMIQLVVSRPAHDFHTCESWHKLVDWYRCTDISGHHRNESGRQSYQCVVFIVCMKDEEKLPPVRFCRLECLTVWPLSYGTSGAHADRGELTERVLQLFLRGRSVLAQAPPGRIVGQAGGP